jgi:eukaryotic-like serine/threonine-protein kinase
MVTSPAADGGPGLPPGVRPLEITDPTEIGGHRLVGRLGSGGMGVVYLGNDEHGGLVAIKAAHGSTADDAVRYRFRAEVACARRVPSAYTARLVADGTDHTPPYIITEYVEGRSLEDIVENDGPLPPQRLRALADGVARALAAIHHAGLIHRDLKPANVLLSPTGPRVIDFGIAQEVPAFGGVTAVGMVMGSPGWISPERLTRSPATRAADIFCWGCLIAYAGTGRNPFGTGDPDEVARRTIEEPADLDGLDASLRHQVEATLAKDPADRPPARRLVAELNPAEPVIAEEKPRHGRHARRASVVRSRRVATFTTGSAMIVAAATLTALVATDSSRPERSEPGVEAAPPTGVAGPHRPDAPQRRGPASGGTSAARSPRPSPVRHRPDPSDSGRRTPTAPGRQRSTGAGVGQDAAKTADRTVGGATTGAPTTNIDNLLDSR